MKNTSIIFMMFLLALARFQMHVEKPILIFVQEVFHHGLREPIFSSNLDGFSQLTQTRSSGQLTKQGKSMHYILGQNLYKLYWHQLFAGTPHANIYDESKFYVQSTKVNRTIESALSQLLGIFENVGKLTIDERDIPFSLPPWPNATRQSGDVYVKSPFYHPVPVILENSQDFLMTFSKKICPQQKKWKIQSQNNPETLQIISNPTFQKAIAIASKILKINLTFWDLPKYYNIATQLQQQGKKVDPIWLEPSPTKAAFEAIKKLQLYIKLFGQEKQRAVTSTGYFQQAYKHFKRVTKDQSGVQWAFYSAHHPTIAGFLYRLDMTSVNCIYENYLKGITLNYQTDSCIVQFPDYASTIIFEVFKYKNSTFTFKIRYNGQLRKIPFCDNKLQCPVERYYEWFKSWRVKNVAQECGIAYHLKLEVEKKRYYEKQLKRYKQQIKKYKRQLEDYRKMQIEFEQLKTKGRLTRPQMKMHISQEKAGKVTK